LIAVTVAVSIAVAAWMGALTFTFMKTESLEWPTTVTFGGTTGSATNNITVTLTNVGSVDVYVSVCEVNGVSKTFNGTLPVKIATAGADQSQTFVISNVGWSAGYNYEVRFTATSGTEFAKTYTAS
jgi:hypothetical protein